MPNADKEAGYCVFRSSASLPCATEVTAQTRLNKDVFPKISMSICGDLNNQLYLGIMM